jgi:hypothetical protein
MELDASQLYADNTWISTELTLSAADKKDLLVAAKEYCDSFDIDDIECSLDKLSSGSILQWRGNKALVVSADFDPFEFQGVLTINQFGSACVATAYKQWLGDSFFAVNHSAEARRRTVIDKLQDLEVIDYFFLVDHVIDQTSDFLIKALKELAATP